MNKRPLILISNDDGYRAQGINTLAEIAREFGDVVVVAPEDTRSGYSLSVTFYDILNVTKAPSMGGGLGEAKGSLRVYSCSGTPGDCVKLGLDTFCERTPDLVLGGINHGDNSSVNAHYSGTVGIVLEGCMKGIPSIAFSHQDHKPDIDFKPMKPYIRMVIDMVLRNGLPKGTCLNVNAPLHAPYKGIRVCSMADGSWGKEIEERESPRGYKYYWLVGHYTCLDKRADSDQRCLEEGYVTITPLQVDLTNYDYIKQLNLELNKKNNSTKD